MFLNFRIRIVIVNLNFHIDIWYRDLVIWILNHLFSYPVNAHFSTKFTFEQKDADVVFKI